MSYYETLKISQTATLNEIEEAFRQLALRYHPDRVNVSSDSSEAAFKKINEAYETLRSPEKRKHYDMLLKIRQSSSKAFNSKAGFARSTNIPPFWSNNTQRSESFSSEPSHSNWQEIKEMTRQDKVNLLDIYLKQHNFSGESFFKRLLSWAAECGSLNVVKYLIEERKVDFRFIVTDTSFFQGSIFKHAAKSGNLDLVKYLLEEHGADIESQATYFAGCRATALSDAAKQGHLDIVKYLISQGANVNPEVANSNILNEAISSGNVEIFKLLVEAGAKLDDFHLESSFRKGCTAIVQYILQLRPGINNHRFYQFPACSVIYSGNLDLLKYLENHHALDIFAPYKDIKNINMSLLTAAANSCSISMMSYLLDEKGLLSLCQMRETPNFYVKNILGNIVQNDALFFGTTTKQEKLKLLRFLMEVKQFNLPADELVCLIQEKTSFSSIEICAYLHSFLPHLEAHHDLLRCISSQGLSGLSTDELFRLYNLDILRQGKYDSFRIKIHFEIQSRHISDEQLLSLASIDEQFKIDALFYYCDYHHKNDLSRLSNILNLGIDRCVKNEQGETAVQFAWHQGGKNSIVEFLKANGFDDSHDSDNAYTLSSMGW